MPWPTTSRHQRGYGAAWVKARERILERDNGLCQCDQCKGGKIRVLPANEVHHIVGKAEAKLMGWEESQIEADDNLMAINSECHKRETQAQQGKRLKPQIGEDGWPLERK